MLHAHFWDDSTNSELTCIQFESVCNRPQFFVVHTFGHDQARNQWGTRSGAKRPVSNSQCPAISRGIRFNITHF
ncbi:hypothetical protein FGIG_12405 [Fasciola gigantica]|uniref:Uncharacterized protein n=1 Tax=Fasciola gigantica TaxID=46835 RepID=A0A504Y534_FASGI|nr:hypothetical protein FGIG_12405 [Fasciola gigantica]